MDTDYKRPAVGLMLPIGSLILAAVLSVSTAARGGDFVRSIGVNVHMEYTDSGYANVGNVIADLRYLGITELRDATLNRNNQGQFSYSLVARAGAHFDLFMTGASTSAYLAKQLSLLDDFAVMYPGSVAAIEGPNEINNFPVSFNGENGNGGALDLQSAMVGAVQADPKLSGVALYNLTTWPDIGSVAPIANYHAYPLNGDQPLAALSSGFNAQAAKMPGKPMVLTEAGYFSLPSVRSGVDLVTQGKLTLNLIMDAKKIGVERIYLYQLLDAYVDRKNSDQQDHYGLFDIDNKAKPVAIYIHNLISILAGSKTPENNTPNSNITYTFVGIPKTASSLLLEKSAGVRDIVVWNEPTVWNATTKSPITAVAATVSLNLGNRYKDVAVYDPTEGRSPIFTSHDVSSLQLSLTDHPLVVEFK